MRVGKVIADYRYANRVGVRDAAKDIGISAATLNRIENGYDCDSISLIKIWGWLFADGGTDKRQKPESE